MKKYLEIFFSLIALSILIGSASAIFLKGLDLVATLRNHWHLFPYLLPIIAILFLYIKTYWSNLSRTSTNSYIDILNGEKKETPQTFSIFILASTWISHLAGASVGREGTAVQIGANISEQLSKKLNFLQEEKSILIRSGIAAGFGSVFGTPWAGAFFGLEIQAFGKYSWKSFLPSIFASFLANYISLHVYEVKHTIYPSIFLPSITPAFIASMIILSLFLALIARLYKALESNINYLFELLPSQKILKGIILGLIITLLLIQPEFKSSIGLGSEKLLEPFSSNFEKSFFLKKLLATTFSLGAGFKGGEATPLFLIGSHAGAFISEYIHVPQVLAAAIGFVGIYCGLAKTPLTGMLLGMELFNPTLGLIFLLTTILIIYFSGKNGLFNQQNWNPKIPKPLF